MEIATPPNFRKLGQDCLALDVAISIDFHTSPRDTNLQIFHKSRYLVEVDTHHLLYIFYLTLNIHKL